MSDTTLSRLKRNFNFNIFDITSSLDTKTGLSRLSERFGDDVSTAKSVETGTLLMETKTVSVKTIIMFFDGCWTTFNKYHIRVKNVGLDVYFNLIIGSV